METTSERPRVLRVDLGQLQSGASVGVSAWVSRSTWLDHIGCWSGGALGLACLFEAASADLRSDAPLAISVGDNVRRGVPTAARASVASRAPLTGSFAEGLVGGEFARRLVRITDALILSGRAQGRGAVLVLGFDGARIETCADLVGLSPRATHAQLVERFGACATLSIGVAGERRLPLASLASGGDPPHFVGRGGLGAVLGRLGLKAIVVTANPVETTGSPALTNELLRSPRLLSRAAGGTMELFDAFQARGELRSSGGELEVERDVTTQLASEIESSRATRHGCQGCPTPCGWTFDTRRGARQGARFGASYALGLQLELPRFDDALELLRDCDEFGLDAKEVGACLGLLARAARNGELADGPSFGDLDAMRTAVRELVEGVGVGAQMRHGAVALARELGLELTSAKGASVRADASLASLLGQCVSSRGGDPMRTFPFLAVDGADVQAMRVSTGLDIEDEAADPRSPRGKGRLVAWHEDWANVLDASGFCAFSAASLLSDRVLDVEALSAAIAPSGLRASGWNLLDAGAALSIVQRRLNELWGVAADADRPQWARALFDQPGMWDEYALARGLDASGRVLPARWRALEALQVWRNSAEVRDAVPHTSVVSNTASNSAEFVAQRPGRVTVRRSGHAARSIMLDLPCGAREVLERLCELEPALHGTYPALFRRGRRVGLENPVFEDDELDLIAVISGG